MRGDEALAVTAGFLVDQIVDIALAIDRELLGAVARDRHITRQPELRMQLFGPGMRVFDEFKVIGRRVARKWTHGPICSPDLAI